LKVFGSDLRNECTYEPLKVCESHPQANRHARAPERKRVELLSTLETLATKYSIQVRATKKIEREFGSDFVQGYISFPTSDDDIWKRVGLSLSTIRKAIRVTEKNKSSVNDRALKRLKTV
jgi:hypothetical protein